MEKPIINISELDYQGFPGGRPEHVKEKYDGSVMGQAAARIGAKKLGYNINKVPPGKRAFPFHSHRVNEEMFFVVEGDGEVRIGDKTYAIKKGDFIACPPGILLISVFGRVTRYGATKNATSTTMTPH